MSSALRGVVIYQRATIDEIAKLDSLPPAMSRLINYMAIQVEIGPGQDHDIFMDGVAYEIAARRDPQFEAVKRVSGMCRGCESSTNKQTVHHPRIIPQSSCSVGQHYLRLRHQACGCGATRRTSHSQKRE